MKKSDLDYQLKEGKITLEDYERELDIINGKIKGESIIKEVKKTVDTEKKNELSSDETIIELLQNIAENTEKTRRNTSVLVNWLIVIPIIIIIIYVFTTYKN